MMIAILLLAVLHPGYVLVGPGAEFPRKTRAEKKAEKRAKKAEKRAKKDLKASKTSSKKNRAQGYIYEEVQHPAMELSQPTSYQAQAYSATSSGGYERGYGEYFVEDGRDFDRPPRYHESR
jgi:hypothetical protein